MKAPGHSKIARAVVPILKRVAPDENYAYFYLGNWLTDFSQVRSPVDYAMTLIAVRRKVWEAVDEVIGDEFGDAVASSTHRYVGDQLAERLARGLLGEPPISRNFRDSRLSEYLRNILFIAGWVGFCAKGVDGKTIPYNAYKRIFDARFTQYYPHEHVDRFPRNRTGLSPHGRSIYAYLDDDLEYVAELLTKVEVDWAKVWAEHHEVIRQREHLPESSQESNDAHEHDLEALLRESETKRQDALVELGHAVHALEDFFAHSTFVDAALRLLGQPPRNAKERRKWRRRLQSEQQPSEYGETLAGAPIPPGPTFVDPNIVTGSFDAIDSGASIHSVADAALNSPRYNLAMLTFSAPQGRKQFNQYDWAQARTAQQQQAMQARYRQRYQGSDIALPLIDARVDAIPQEVQDAQIRLMQIDWELTELAQNRPQFSLRGGPLPAPGTTETPEERSARVGILQGLVDEAEANAKRRFPDGSHFHERIGTHTLIAKDGEESEPGYHEAMNLAIRLSTYVAEVMVDAIQRPSLPIASSSNGGVTTVRERHTDWLELVRYFCGHPAEATSFDPLEATRHPLLTIDGDVGFAAGEDSLSPTARNQLLDIVTRYKSNPGTLERVDVEGHTDSRGKRRDNKALAQRRADTVAAFLYEAGIPSEQITVYAYGETNPRVPNRTAAGRAQNRRVELWAYYQDSEPLPTTQWWRQCMKNPKGNHGHLLLSISAKEQERRAGLPMRARLQQEYDSYAVIQENRYQLWRANGNGGRNTQRNIQIKKGQEFRLKHNDVDHGAVRIVCREGRVRATLSTAVWFTSEQQENVTLGAGDAWAQTFVENSDVSDQDNLLVVHALTDAICEVQMISYDYRPSGVAGDVADWFIQDNP